MTIARKRLVSVQATPYYHVIGRCVRRGFLCGIDDLSGRNYEHRRDWIVSRLGELAEIFAIDILAYAVMSNHYHLVVRLRPEHSSACPAEEVLERWQRLYGLPDLLRKFRAGACDEAERAIALQLLEVRRHRLASLSWLMKCLNEPIARRANREDHCSGAFWEGRFKSQALLDEKALLSCMAYVDLNPIRAKRATLPEQSDHTSIQARINHQLSEPVRLALFRDQAAPDRRDDVIPLDLSDYLTLVDWSGRVIRAGKRGTIAAQRPPILERLGLDQRTWLQTFEVYQKPFAMVGSPDRVKAAAKVFSKHWFRGIGEMGLFAKK